MKIKSTSTLILLALLTVNGFTQAQAANQLKLSNLSNLALSAQEQGYAGVLITPANSTDSAKYSATGPAGSTTSASVVENKIYLTSSTTQQKITAYGWTYGGDMNHQGGFHFPHGADTTTNNLLVGCSAYVKADVQPGNYSGVAHFRITNNGTVITTPFLVTMAILATNSVENQRPMTFPTQMAGFTGTYVLNPNATGAAMFSASGNAGANAVAQVIPNSVNLTLTGSNKTIKVFGFTFGGYEGHINPQTGEFLFPTGLGQTIARDILVGASAYYEPNLLAGEYSGTATLRITYR